MDSKESSSFGERIYLVVSHIPSGHVMTYGQIASLCGNPRAARIVGGVAHFGNKNLPWHRVVNKQGGLATGYPGGQIVQQKLLESEGVEVDNFTVNINKILWKP